MNGIVYILDTEYRVGKIVFEDGRESKPMCFPINYESGDLADTEFVNGDPEKPLIKLSAVSPLVHYGSLLVPKPGASPSPFIIVNYPLPIGLVKYRLPEVDFPIDHKHRNVCFRINKDAQGGLLATHVKQTDDNESHRCSPPLYGLLHEEQSHLSEAYVSEIKTSNTGIHSGQISRIVTMNRGLSDEYQFGFVSTDEIPNIFFNLRVFKLQHHDIQPTEGMSVYFCMVESEKGFRITRFISENHVPPARQSVIKKTAGKQYTVDKELFVRFYQREPNPGDIVHGFIAKNAFSFADSKQHIVRALYLRPDIIDKAQGIQSGKIINYDSQSGIGMIKTHNGTVLRFDYRIYDRCLGGYPLRSKAVLFQEASDKAADSREVISFLSYDCIDCGELHSNSYSLIDPEDVFRVYRDQAGGKVEIHKVNLNNLAEAVGCYKSPDLNGKHRLQALETLIRHRFCDKRIRFNDLVNERRRILEDLSEESLTAGRFDQAMDYEFRLQELHYNPQILRKFKDIPLWAKAILTDVRYPDAITDQSPWRIDFDYPVIGVQALTDETAWCIEIRNTDESLEVAPDEGKWSIHLTGHTADTNLAVDKILFNIDI